MKQKLSTLVLILLLPLGVLLSCGGDSGTVSGGGIGGTGVTVGPITGFGSIEVNDVHLDIENADVTLEGSPGDAADPDRGLKLGMLVVAQAVFHDDGLTGVAQSVAYEDNLEGPVDVNGVDVNNSQLSVLGQTVVVNTATRIEDQNSNQITLADIQDGNVVEVSGLADANGNIVATRIEIKALQYQSGMEIEIKGTISNLDENLMFFNIGGLLVDYGVAQIEDAPGGVLADGLFVEVKSQQAPAGGTLLASEVEVKSPLTASLGGEGDKVEIEGFVTEVVSPTEFKVNGHPVRTTAATRFEGGASGNIQVNARVEVEGFLDADGVLVAVEVEFEDGSGDDPGGDDSSDDHSDDDS